MLRCEDFAETQQARQAQSARRFWLAAEPRWGRAGIRENSSVVKRQFVAVQK